MKNLLHVLLVFIMACGVSETDNDSSTTNDKISVKAPQGMVYIPGGNYSMGGNSEQADSDEFPKHDVRISAFYMDETEITNAEFKKFVDATGYVTVAERDIDWEAMKNELPEGTPKPADSLLKAGSLVFIATDGPVNLQDYSQWWKWTIGANWKSPKGPQSLINDHMNYPVIHVSWEDAQAYALWAGKTLPTEAQWEWAAMGGLENTKYPWGNEPVENAYDKANFWQGFFPFENLKKDGFSEIAPVKSFSPNGYGLYDMAGNVWEWCNDKYRFDTYQMSKNNGIVQNPLGPNDSFDPTEPWVEKYAMRGGSFLCNDSYCSGYRVSRRMKSSKDSGFNHTGFRCVKRFLTP